VPLTIPSIDVRTYQDLLNEAMARIPSHNPEWTNFNKSDPGVTLLEVFAFLTESLIYRANLIPERNRKKFLQLLGQPLYSASAAQGLVRVSNDRGPLEVFTLDHDLEVQAGEVPFRTTRGLDVLPVDYEIYYKRPVVDPDETELDHYHRLYASHLQQMPGTEVTLYQTTRFSPRGTEPIDLGTDTIDGSLWIALLARATDRGQPPDLFGDAIARERELLAGKTVSIGVVPSPPPSGKLLQPGGAGAASAAAPTLKVFVPQLPPDGILPDQQAQRVATYVPLHTAADRDLLSEPGILEVELPSSAAQLSLWRNLQALESGVGDFPPAIDDSTQAQRLITWLRVRPSGPTSSRILWLGLNCTPVTQRAHVSGELLPPGNGEPDQSATLARRPVLPETLVVTVASPGNDPESWKPIDDLLSAGPEVPVPDPRLPPGAPPARPAPSKVFAIDPEAGVVRFGDGLRGARPARGAILRASYDFAVGKKGNVGPGSIKTGPSLPSGLAVSNPLRTWGGADAESESDGERQVPRYLSHRDRLVNAVDFQTIARRTPGVDLARVEVLPAYHPDLGNSQPGDAPGAVTLMLVPRYDPEQPDSPRPDDNFLQTVACFLEPRRLVTTALYLRGPKYHDIYFTVGFNAVAGASLAEVREAVKKALREFLSPLPDPDYDPQALQPRPGLRAGWPLQKPVVALELLGVANRVPGVQLVNGVQLGDSDGTLADQVKMEGLELPRLVGIDVAIGDAPPLSGVRGQTVATPPSALPVPFVPEECG
jgi:hypothetical protein